VESPGEIVEMESGGGFGSYCGDIRPDPSNRGDVFQMSPYRRGVIEIPIVAGDLTAMGDPDRAISGGGCERRGESIGCGTDSRNNGSIYTGERRRRHRRLEVRLDAVVDGLIGELLLGESTRCGGEAIRSEEREENRKYLRVPVYENRVRVVSGPVR
jgi:hypothetical protein